MTRGYHPELIQHVFVDFIGQRLHPFWSLTTPKLRLLSTHSLDNDLIASRFETNYAFRQQSAHQWRGGEHISVTVPIDGVRHQRQYSLVGLPDQTLWWQDDKRHTLTIAIKSQGLISKYLTQQAALGDIFECSVPSGRFTLEQTLSSTALDDQSPVLFIASGSGITPMLGLVTEALQSGRPVTLLHYNRTPILTSFWENLAATYSAFTYHLIATEDTSTYLAGSRHLTTQSLLALNLPLAHTQIYACGSQALLASLYQAADDIVLDSAASLRDNITIEQFGTSYLKSDPALEPTDAVARTVYLRGRQRQYTCDSTLLISAEEAGIRLPHGCRQGICHLCRCQKISGQVKNTQTGVISGAGFESIQTCINVALTDVILDV